MVKTLTLAGALSAVVSGALAQTAGQWGQCGGTGWTGATLCPTGWYCAAVSPPYYYQCLQGAGSTTTSTSTVKSSTSTSKSSTTTTKSSTTPGTTIFDSSPLPSTTKSTTSVTTTSAASSSTPTLIAGYSFIRGVEAPFFHLYLQSEVLNTASDAVLGSPMTAAQFVITNGQLIQQGNNLYAQVEAPTTGAVKLKVTWAATANTVGTFMWSGDTLEWSSPTVTRSQLNAWLICADSAGHDDVYINLGPYAYNTPAGCGDQTIHAYTGPYPTS